MTPLNTIIEEEKKETEKLTNMVVRIMRGMYNSNEARIADVRSAITNSRTTAMQRAYEAGRRDTVEEMKGEVRLLASKHYKTEDFDIEGFINDLGLLQHNNKEELKDISKDV